MTMTFDDIESIDLDSEDWEDDFDDSEDYDEDYGDDALGEASLAQRRRRRRGRQLELQRRRRRARATAAARRRRRSGPRRRSAPTPRAAVNAIRELDIENKVQDDSFRAALAAQRKRQDRAEVATVAAVVAKQVQDSFGGSVDLLQNPAAKAALNAAPLLLLPSRKKDGVGGYLTDAKFIGVAAVAAAAFIGDQQNKSSGVGDARITGAAEIDEGDETVVIVDVFDKRGRQVERTVEFTADPPDVVTVDATGRVRTLKSGVAVLTAKVEGVVRRHVLRVRARSAPPVPPGKQ